MREIAAKAHAPKSRPPGLNYIYVCIFSNFTPLKIADPFPLQIPSQRPLTLCIPKLTYNIHLLAACQSARSQGHESNGWFQYSVTKSYKGRIKGGISSAAKQTGWGLCYKTCRNLVAMGRAEQCLPTNPCVLYTAGCTSDPKYINSSNLTIQ